MTAMTKKSFLFLQGPCGPFFRKLGRALSRDGHSVLRINFNGGDVLQWPGSLTRHFQGMPQDWPAFVDSLKQQHSITDLCVFGDCRPYHSKAIQVLKPYGVRVHVFEEGYFRPRWITLEEGGVNGYSSLPGDPAYYMEEAASYERFPPSVDTGKSKRYMFWYYFHYFWATGYLSPLFPQFKKNGHYPDSLRLYPSYAEVTGDFLQWLFRLFGSRRLEKNANLRLNRLQSQQVPYFLVPLQLSIDSQITCHSPYTGMQEFISQVIASFARHAPKDTALIFKNHPLDPVVRASRIVAELETHRYGVVDRVVFIDGGHLPTILQNCRGTVVINSTSGLSSIHHGVPTLNLGKAIYNISGLTFRGSLDEFWSNHQVPDNELYNAFRKVVMHKTQKNGNFYTPKGVRLALEHVVPAMSTAEAEHPASTDLHVQHGIASCEYVN